MNFKFYLKSALLLVLIITLANSCRKGQQSSWNTDLLVPIVTTNLSLQNLVRDSSIRTNRDSSLTLSYQSSLFQFNLDTQIIKIPDTSIGQRVSLDSLQLPSTSIVYPYSLGTMAQSLGAEGQFLILNNHDSLVIPPISGISPAPVSYSLASYLDSAYLISGVVEIWIVNKLPVPINHVVITMSNSDGTLIGSDSIPNSQYSSIAQKGQLGDSVFLSIPIGSCRITNQIIFSITQIASVGSNGQKVYIDTSDNITARIYIHSLRVSEAWAKFPQQNVVDQTAGLTLNLGARKFTYIEARTGKLHIYITNSVPLPLYLQYTLVGAHDNRGNPLNAYTHVPAAPVNSTVTIDTIINISGYSISLTGPNGSQFNTYTQRIIGRIDSSISKVHLTLADSLYITYVLEDIAPGYIKGYAGRDTVVEIDTASFSFLNMFQSGSIDLASVNMNFSVSNGIGVDGIVKINSLSATSSLNGTQNLSGSILGQPLRIGRATDFPLTPAISNFSLNNSNSNIRNLLGILPNQLRYNVTIQTNPNGDNHQYRDFAYLQSSLGIGLNAQIPLSLIANHLVLKDTVNFNLSNTQTNVNGITDGIINIIAENKYPITAILTMVVYDVNNSPVDTLVMNQTIAGASLNNSCRAVNPTRTVIPEYVNQTIMNRLKQGTYAVLTADFSTSSNNASCNGQHLTIYSDYNIGITLTAKFNYKVSAKL